jgi:repressor of nif and glnA expression
MINKKTIESVILGILDREKLPSHSIREELEKRGIKLTYDTVKRYLRRMTREGEIKRATLTYYYRR